MKEGLLQTAVTTTLLGTWSSLKGICSLLERGLSLGFSEAFYTTDKNS